MSEIIYLKDIMQAKATTKKEKESAVRTKLKPFKYEKIMKSSLVEKRKKKTVRDNPHFSISEK